MRACHWHQRSIDEVVSRYPAPVWARRDPDGNVRHALDDAVEDRQVLFDRLRIIDAERADEVALWLPHQRALVFGDEMIRSAPGELRIRPESWTQPEGGSARLRSLLAGLTGFRSSMFWCPMACCSSATGWRRRAAPQPDADSPRWT